MGQSGDGGRREQKGRSVFNDWLQATFFFLNRRKAGQTRGFSVEPVKLVLSSLGLFSLVLFGKLAIQRSASSGALLIEAGV